MKYNRTCPYCHENGEAYWSLGAYNRHVEQCSPPKPYPGVCTCSPVFLQISGGMHRQGCPAIEVRA